MKTYTKEELADILAKHNEWLNTRWSDSVKGSRADLTRADLTGRGPHGRGPQGRGPHGRGPHGEPDGAWLNRSEVLALCGDAPGGGTSDTQRLDWLARKSHDAAVTLCFYRHGTPEAFYSVIERMIHEAPTFRAAIDAAMQSEGSRGAPSR